ncbi:Calcium uniporter protein [Thalictrum thalictroides]|uniref:Calcium uniporter protein n=1 Tax=Thalictrum thalictroides TaxID=46969 RepID=A0A7J6VL68_THATH|nr:Calcium uniporter protein [Thalictrum thalictroides]
MAFRKTLAQRLYHITKITSPTSAIMPNQSLANIIFRRDYLNATDSNKKKGFFRRFLQSAATSSELRSSLMGDKLMNKLKEMNLSKKEDRLRLDGLYPPALEVKPEPPEEISIEDTKKILKISQLEILKSKLKQIQKNCVSYDEFIEICVVASDQGLEFAKMLDDSGSVIVLGNIVFLHPEQVTKAISGIIPLTQPNDPRMKELEKMEKEKVEIDKEADALVRKELWAGLGFLVVQTAGLMRLTFWELSWDVMEPICFYVTSIYFMAGYSFFLKTSKDPSFEGFFESRFSAKQKSLMKKKNFDVERFNELKRACYPFISKPTSSNIRAFDTSESTLTSALYH